MTGFPRRGEPQWSKYSSRNAASTPAASRDAAELMRLACTKPSPTARGNGRKGPPLKSDAASILCVPRFAIFNMNADEIDAQIRELAAERRLPPSHLARWLALDPSSRAAMLDLARDLRLRTGQLVHALETLEEIAM